MAGRQRKLTVFEEALLFELRAIRLAIVDHSKNTGKWLSAVATAAANPADNTAEIREKLAEITADIKAEADAFEATAEAATLNNRGE